MLEPRVTSFALKVAAVRDAGDGEWRHVEAAFLPIPPYPCRPLLPPHRTVHKKGQRRVSEADAHGIPKKKPNVLVEQVDTILPLFQSRLPFRCSS